MSRDLDGKHLKRAGTIQSDEIDTANEGCRKGPYPDCLKSILGEIKEVRTNLKRILSHFQGGKIRSIGDLKKPIPVAAPVSKSD